MAQDMTKGREQFVERLRQTASDKKIPIDRLASRGIPDKDAFEVVVESGGKTEIFTIPGQTSIEDPEGEIEQIINSIIDNNE